ncbi:MAG: tetratricopeptide repeat protein [Deltaproteobacteria bacterium]|nr:tetratricopeptide repeat protein [Deltaproteobacteria bacterium]
MIVLLVVTALAGRARADDGGLPAASVGGAGAAPADTETGVAMTGVVDEAVRKLAEARNAEARKLMRKKDFPGALERLKDAYELDPSSAEIAGNLAYIYALLGNNAEAERLYREALALEPDRFVTYLNLADLLGRKAEAPERLAEAATLLGKARELRGNQPKVILRQARVATLRGLFADAERFYQEYLARQKADDALRVEIGDFYRDLGREDEALSWYRQVSDADDIGQEAAKRIFELEVERQARSFGWTRKPEAVPDQARLLATRGRIELNQGRLDEAERLLRQALSLAPGFAMAHADLGDLERRRGRETEAELCDLRALALDHGNAEFHARLADLYLTGTAHRAPEAALFFARALDLRPDWTDLNLKLALALREAGDLPRALLHVNRFLAAASGGADRDRAVALKGAIEELLPPGQAKGAAVTGEPGRKSDRANPTLVDALSRARARLARGEPDGAMAELRRLADAERGAEVLNLEARILYSVGRLDEAAAALAESLERDGAQADVHEQLGVILAGKGERQRARMQLERAEQLGNLSAVFHMARLDTGDRKAGLLSWTRDAFEVGALLAARSRLARFLAQGSTSVHLDEARALRETVADRLLSVAAAGSVLLLLAACAVAFAAHRRIGGRDLAHLVARHPEAGPEVQRVLSAIRHEVLKHNTMALAGLVEAVERGDPDAGDKAAFVRMALLGDGKADAVVARLAQYAARLEKTGKAHGVRLNLRRNDAAMSALLRGFALLEQAAPLLDGVQRLSRPEREGLARMLKEAARLLNSEGYEAVRDLLDRLRILEIDRPLLESIFERTRREPAFVAVRFAPLAIDIRVDMPCGALIPRQAFEDIAANLVRNAIQSSLTGGGGEVAVGMGLEGETDPITGLERVVLLVKDRSPRELTADMLRGRDIADGLGLTVDLVSRFEGTIDVVPGMGGWAKAVAVKLPRAYGKDGAR